MVLGRDFAGIFGRCCAAVARWVAILLRGGLRGGCDRVARSVRGGCVMGADRLRGWCDRVARSVARWVAIGVRDRQKRPLLLEGGLFWINEFQPRTAITRLASSQEPPRPPVHFTLPASSLPAPASVASGRHAAPRGHPRIRARRAYRQDGGTPGREHRRCHRDRVRDRLRHTPR